MVKPGKGFNNWLFGVFDGDSTNRHSHMTKAKSHSKKPDPEVAKQALREAEERRAKGKLSLPKELDGRGGPEPTRYGDWENKGITSDF